MALRKEKNDRATEGANDDDDQQQHWQLLFDRIGDESFDGGGVDSRAVVKAHLSKLLGVNDGDSKEREEPAVVGTRTASQLAPSTRASTVDLSVESGLANAAEGEYEMLEKSLANAAADDYVDDALIATPTRLFLSSLFNSDNCMTPFALL